MPLADFYEEASDQDIREVLEHPGLAAVSPDALAVGANQWVRKRFAMLKNSGVLDLPWTKELFRGAITETLYETNSKREVE